MTDESIDPRISDTFTQEDADRADAEWRAERERVRRELDAAGE